MGKNARTWRQHVVSQALLNRFRNDGGGLVGFYDLRYGSSGQRSARSLGYESNFVTVDPDLVESTWKEIEDPIAQAFDEIDQAPDVLSQGTVSAVKNFVALHYARSLATSAIHTETLTVAEEQVRADKQMLAHLARIKHHGLHLEHAQDIHHGIAEEIIERVREQESSGQVFRNDLLRIFEVTKACFFGYSLMIRPAIGGAEFMLGDCPAVSVARGMNPMVRAPLFDSSMIVMPMGRWSVAFVYPDGLPEPTVPVRPEDAKYINRGQVAQAKRQVYFSPSSGLGSWAKSYRPPTRSTAVG